MKSKKNGMIGLVLLVCALAPPYRGFSQGEKRTDGAYVFNPHPRIVYTAKQLKEIRTSPGKEGYRKGIIARGEKLLKEEIYIPKEKEGGNWIFYYACPDDGCRLRAKSLTEHQCPKCKKVFTDERTVASYRTILYNKADREILELARAYAVSGDDRFAAPVKKAFLELVAVYPTLQRHDRWGRKGIFAVVGGRRFCQHLSEAVSIIKLAKAWDLCRESKVFTDEDRDNIEKNFLERTVREIASLSRFAGGRNNHQTWFNAAYVNVGAVTGDKELLDLGYKGKRGLLWQLQNSVTDDGIWYEGTISYHFYALQAIIKTLEALRCVGVDLSDNKRLKSLWLGPLNLTYPNGRMPALNDGDPYNLKAHKGIYAFAYNYFRDPVFANLAGIKLEGKAGKEEPLKSVNLNGIGIAVLRRGTGKSAVSLFLDYGIHGGAHGHPDKLNIILFCLDKELIIDPGRISYSVPEFKTWCRTTVAHNTVIVDQRDQAPTTGKLLYFTETDQWSACLGEGGNAYPGTELRRFLLMTDSFLVDFFYVRKEKSLFGKDDSLFDWILHCRGKLKANCPATDVTQGLGKTNGYQHLTDVKKIEKKSPVWFDFEQKNSAKIRMYAVGESGDIYTGNGIGVSKQEKVPFVLRRRLEKTGENCCFLTVYDFSGDASAVHAVKPVLVRNDKNQVEAQAVGLRIEGKENFLIGLDARAEPGSDLRVEGNLFKHVLFRREK